MKKIAILAAVFYFLVIILSGCAHNNREEGNLIRIHVRANSNLAADQEVKLAVKQEVVDYLDNLLAWQTDFSKALAIVEASIDYVEEIATATLRENGFEYGVRVSLKREYFPTRAYENVVVESGVYDALIIELGSGDGDNWWCVIYPPLCFTSRESYGSDFAYKSKLAELWRKYFPSSK